MHDTCVSESEKSFVAAEVIREASFHIEEHEKAALIGINGAGKSTLLKMIIGELAPDSGQVILARERPWVTLLSSRMFPETKQFMKPFFPPNSTFWIWSRKCGFWKSR